MKLKKGALVFVVPTVVLSLFSYIYICSNMSDLLRKEIQDNQKAKELYTKNIQELQSLNIEELQQTIDKDKQEILSLQRAISAIQQDKSMLVNEMMDANTKVKDTKQITKHLQSSSKANNITLNKVNNLSLKGTPAKKQTINMQIVGAGKYDDIIKFIKDLEQFSSMVEIKDIKIEKKAKLEFSINVEGWEFVVSKRA